MPTLAHKRESMDYFGRYKNGEYEQVWNDLQLLGPSVRNQEVFAQAQLIAHETMARVRRNCETLISRLTEMGYVFDRYPDGTRRSYRPEPLSPPTEEMRYDQIELEGEVGPLPISLVGFWNEVGAVDLVGTHPEWPDGLDPLVVHPPIGALSSIYDYVVEDGSSIRFGDLAPDDLHKDNISGGDPYGVDLPNPSADFLFRNERHGLHFVPYLRLAILEWGGFPGLDGEPIQFAPLGELIKGLETF
jgi:hypothetical protein